MGKPATVETCAETDVSFLAARIEHCFTDEYVVSSGISPVSAAEKLTTLPDETLRYLADTLRDESFAEDSEYTLDRMLIFMLDRGTTVRDMEDIAFLLSNNGIVLEMSLDYFDWDEEGTIPTALLKDLIVGLRSYEDCTGFDYDKNMPIRQQGQKIMDQCVALVTMADYLEMLNEYQMVYGMTVVADWELAELVAEYPKRVDDIISEISVNGDENIPMIRAIISGEVHRALGEGVL